MNFLKENLQNLKGLSSNSYLFIFFNKRATSKQLKTNGGAIGR